eukprot:1544710-Amphidinium_carterae.2
MTLVEIDKMLCFPEFGSSVACNGIVYFLGMGVELGTIKATSLQQAVFSAFENDCVERVSCKRL